MDVLATIKHNQSLLAKIFSTDKETAQLRNTLREACGVKPYTPGEYTIATGHQPIPYYPGLLSKNYFAGKHANRLNLAAYNFVVDTDQNAITIPVPCVAQGAFCKDLISLKSEADTVFAAFNPDRKSIEIFFEAIENRLSTLENQQIKLDFAEWKRGFMAEYTRQPNFIDTLVNQRKKFENSLNLNLENIRISGIANTPAFYHYVGYILKYLKRFATIYNRAVKLHSKGNYRPVKYIREKEGWTEIPFWLIKNEKRYPVWVRKTDNSRDFWSAEANEYCSIPCNGTVLAAEELRRKLTLYPKANTLTLMLRLFLADLLIHGTGAEEYERVNNFVIKEFYGLEAKPAFYSATGDIYLPLQEAQPAYREALQQFETIGKWLKEYRRNPEDLLDAETASYYKARKKHYATMLRRSKAQAERKQLHEKMTGLNEKMKSHLEKQKKYKEARYAYLKNLLDKKHIFYERCYPYFFYPQNSLCTKDFEEQLVVKRIQ